MKHHGWLRVLNYSEVSLWLRIKDNASTHGEKQNDQTECVSVKDINPLGLFFSFFLLSWALLGIFFTVESELKKVGDVWDFLCNLCFPCLGT